MALAMFSTATARNPSATCSGVVNLPPSARTFSVRAVNFLRTMSVSIERFPWGPKTFGKNSGGSLPEHYVGVGYAQGATITVTSGAGISPRRVRSDPKPHSVEMKYRTSTRGYGMNIHHRRPHANARDLGFKTSFVFAREVSNIG